MNVKVLFRTIAIWIGVFILMLILCSMVETSPRLDHFHICTTPDILIKAMVVTLFLLGCSALLTGKLDFMSYDFEVEVLSARAQHVSTCTDSCCAYCKNLGYK